MSRFRPAVVATLLLATAPGAGLLAQTVHEGALQSQVDLLALRVESPSMVAMTLGSENFDTTLALFRLADEADPASAELVGFNDDDPASTGRSTDSALSQLLDPGLYLIGVSDYMEGSAGTYTLSVRLMPLPDGADVVDNPALRAEMGGDPPLAVVRSFPGYLARPSDTATTMRLLGPDGLFMAGYHVLTSEGDGWVRSRSLVSFADETLLLLDDPGQSVLVENETGTQFTLSTWDVDPAVVARLSGDMETESSVTLPAHPEKERVAVSWGWQGFADPDAGMFSMPSVVHLVAPGEDETVTLAAGFSSLGAGHREMVEEAAVLEYGSTRFEITLHDVVGDTIQRVRSNQLTEISLATPFGGSPDARAVEFAEPTTLLVSVANASLAGATVSFLNPGGTLLAETFLEPAEGAPASGTLDVPAARGWLVVSMGGEDENFMEEMVAMMFGTNIPEEFAADFEAFGARPEVRILALDANAESTNPALEPFEVEDLSHFVALTPTLGMLSGGGAGTLQGGPAPNFVLPVMMGSDAPSINLESLRGKVVVIDFWATWCGPCIRAMPSLQALHEAHAESGDVVVLGVVDEPASLIRGTVDRLGLTFPQLDDSDSLVYRLYGVSAIPRTLIIDREGNVAHDITGFHGDDALANHVAALLAE